MKNKNGNNVNDGYKLSNINKPEAFKLYAQKIDELWMKCLERRRPLVLLI